MAVYAMYILLILYIILDGSSCNNVKLEKYIVNLNSVSKIQRFSTGRNNSKVVMNLSITLNSTIPELTEKTHSFFNIFILNASSLYFDFSSNSKLNICCTKKGPALCSESKYTLYSNRMKDNDVIYLEPISYFYKSVGFSNFFPSFVLEKTIELESYETYYTFIQFCSDSNMFPEFNKEISSIVNGNLIFQNNDNLLSEDKNYKKTLYEITLLVYFFVLIWLIITEYSSKQLQVKMIILAILCISGNILNLYHYYFERKNYDIHSIYFYVSVLVAEVPRPVLTLLILLELGLYLKIEELEENRITSHSKKTVLFSLLASLCWFESVYQMNYFTFKNKSVPLDIQKSKLLFFARGIIVLTFVFLIYSKLVSKAQKSLEEAKMLAYKVLRNLQHVLLGLCLLILSFTMLNLCYKIGNRDKLISLNTCIQYLFEFIYIYVLVFLNYWQKIKYSQIDKDALEDDDDEGEKIEQDYTVKKSAHTTTIEDINYNRHNVQQQAKPPGRRYQIVSNITRPRTIELS